LRRNSQKSIVMWKHQNPFENILKNFLRTDTKPRLKGCSVGGGWWKLSMTISGIAASGRQMMGRLHSLSALPMAPENAHSTRHRWNFRSPGCTRCRKRCREWYVPTVRNYSMGCSMHDSIPQVHASESWLEDMSAKDVVWSNMYICCTVMT
jgi:hypothetical protein